MIVIASSDYYQLHHHPHTLSTISTIIVTSTASHNQAKHATCSKQKSKSARAN